VKRRAIAFEYLLLLMTVLVFPLRERPRVGGCWRSGTGGTISVGRFFENVVTAYFAKACDRSRMAFFDFLFDIDLPECYINVPS
jgi:hypothetical protein